MILHRFIMIVKSYQSMRRRKRVNNYKLIACDLDGTLIGSNLKLSKENYEAIKEIADKVQVLQYEDTMENWRSQYRRISTGEI